MGLLKNMYRAIKGTQFVTTTAPILYTAYNFGLVNPYVLVAYGITFVIKTFL